MGFVDRYDAFNEKVTLFFLRFVGPPSVSRAKPHAISDAVRERDVELRGGFDRVAKPHAISDAVRERDVELRGGFDRVVGADGQEYLVER